MSLCFATIPLPPGLLPPPRHLPRSAQRHKEINKQCLVVILRCRVSHQQHRKKDEKRAKACTSGHDRGAGKLPSRMERSVVHLSFWAWLCAVSIHISAFDCCTRRALDLLTQAVILMWKMFCNCSEEVFLKNNSPLLQHKTKMWNPKVHCQPPCPTSR